MTDKERVEERIGSYDQCSHMLPGKTSESRIDFCITTAIENNKLLVNLPRRLLHVPGLSLPLCAVLVDKQADHISVGDQST